MSVQTQIDRISGAVSDALVALTEKGVSVPAGTKVDGLAALIAAIEAGGGSGAKIATGTVTTNGALSSGRYALGPLDFEPTFAAIIRSEEPSTKRVLIGSITDCTPPFRFYCSYNTSSSMYSKVANKSLTNVSTGFLLYDTYEGDLEYYNGETSAFMDGTYTWVAIG